jgi:hypothetical protein
MLITLCGHRLTKNSFHAKPEALHPALSVLAQCTVPLTGQKKMTVVNPDVTRDQNS